LEFTAFANRVAVLSGLLVLGGPERNPHKKQKTKNFRSRINAAD